MTEGLANVHSMLLTFLNGRLIKVSSTPDRAVQLAPYAPPISLLSTCTQFLILLVYNLQRAPSPSRPKCVRTFHKFISCVLILKAISVQCHRQCRNSCFCAASVCLSVSASLQSWPFDRQMKRMQCILRKDGLVHVRNTPLTS